MFRFDVLVARLTILTTFPFLLPFVSIVFVVVLLLVCLLLASSIPKIKIIKLTSELIVTKYCSSSINYFFNWWSVGVALAFNHTD